MTESIHGFNIYPNYVTENLIMRKREVAAMQNRNGRRTAYNTALIEQRADPYVLRAEDGTRHYFTASVRIMIVSYCVARIIDGIGGCGGDGYLGAA